MSQPGKFQAYYESTLAPELARLERHRRWVLLQVVVCLLCVWVSPYVVVRLFFGHPNWMQATVIFVASALVAGFVAPAVAGLMSRYYLEAFDRTIAPLVVSFIDRSLVCRPSESVGREAVMKAAFFDRNVSESWGRCLVEGAAGAARFRVSEMRVCKRVRRSTKHGAHIGSEAIFLGLFGVVEGVLQPDVPRLLARWRKRTGREVRAAFRDRVLYLAVPYVVEGSLVPSRRLFRSVAGIDAVQGWYEDLAMAVAMLREVVPSPSEQPITLGGGRFKVKECLAGDRVRGLFRAYDEGGPCLVSLVSGYIDQEGIDRALGMDLPGVRPLLFAGKVDGRGGQYAVVEAEPSGKSLAEWFSGPLPPVKAGEIVRTLAHVTRSVAVTRQMAAGGLHPRLVYMGADGKLSGLVLRGVHLLDRWSGEGRGPVFSPSFEAPEVLCGGVVRRTEATDVFQLCAMLAWLCTGRYPFGSDVVEEYRSHYGNRRELPGVPEEIRGVVHSGLALEAAKRLSLAELIRSLEALSGPGWPAAAAARPGAGGAKLPRYCLVGARPVKAEATPDGGMSVQALDWKTGEFVRAAEYAERIFLPDGEVDCVSEAEFNAAVEAIRARLRPSGSGADGPRAG